MVYYSELMIGDWIQIDGIPRQVQAITKKKVGYHITPNECRMHYARLSECEYLPIYSIEFNDKAFTINFNIIIELKDNINLEEEMVKQSIGWEKPKITIRYWLTNLLGERLLYNLDFVHKLQRQVNFLNRFCK